MDEDDRLYGEPGAEYMQIDPYDVWERHVDGEDLAVIEADGWKLEIEEWTVAPTSKMMPKADALTDRIVEWWFEETSEEHYESVCIISGRPEVIQAFQQALDVFSAAVDTKGWKMADRLVVTHVVTYVHGVYYYDGEATDWENG